MYEKFTQSEIEALKHYVYCLVDPRDKRIFYIGKGQGDRVFYHAKDALSSNEESLKLDKIRDIKNAGHDVEYYIIRHGLNSSNDAFLIESTLIDLLSYPSFNKDLILTNIVAGHHQWDEGIKTIDEIAQIYQCEKFVPNSNHFILMVNLNRSYIQKNANGVYLRKNIYEATRKYWHLNKNKADKIDYLLGVYKGVVRVVIKPTTKWKLVKFDDEGNKFSMSRYEIEGVIDDEEGNRLYLNKDVKDFSFGSGGAIRYIDK